MPGTMNATSELYHAIERGLVDAGLCPDSSSLHLDLFQPSGRKAEATAIRVTVSLNGSPQWSIKAYPRGSIFDSRTITTAHHVLANIGTVRIPLVLASWENEEWTFIVENHIPNALDLETLVSEHIVSADEAHFLQGNILKAIHSQSANGRERPADERDRLLAAIREAPLTKSQRERLHAWTAANYLFISHPPVWTTLDVIPANILQAPTGPEGQDEWWLVDFDLACLTALPWYDVLRAARMSPWGLAYWDDAWGNPASVALALLTRVLEWDLQRRVSNDANAYHEHPIMLQAAFDAWDRLLGFNQTSSTATLAIHQAIPDANRDVLQIFWDDGNGFSEQNSKIIPWPISDDIIERHIVFSPAIAAQQIRIDFSNAPCVFEILDLMIDSETDIRHADLTCATISGDAIAKTTTYGLLVASVGSDPQMIFPLQPAPATITCITIIGRKNRGLDASISADLIRHSPTAEHFLNALVTTDHKAARAMLAGQRAQQAKMEEELATTRQQKRAAAEATITANHRYEALQETLTKVSHERDACREALTRLEHTTAEAATIANHRYEALQENLAKVSHERDACREILARLELATAEAATIANHRYEALQENLAKVSHERDACRETLARLELTTAEAATIANHRHEALQEILAQVRAERDAYNEILIRIRIRRQQALDHRALRCLARFIPSLRLLLNESGQPQPEPKDTRTHNLPDFRI
jgi:hypothetical protein